MDSPHNSEDARTAPTDLPDAIRSLEIGACNLSKLREVVDAAIAKQIQWTGTPIPNGYAGTIAADLWVHLQTALLAVRAAIAEAEGR